MGDDLNILLSAMLDEPKSASNINKQIQEIQKKLKEINITLNVADIDKSLNDILDGIEKKTKRNSKLKVEFKSLDKTISDIKSLSKNLDSVFNDLQKIGKVKSLNQLYDNNGSVKGFTVQLESVKNGLKEISTYNVLGNFKKDIGEWEYGLKKVSSKITEVINKSNNIGKTKAKTNPMSGLQKAIDETVKAYKNGTLDIESYIKKMQSMIYDKNSNGTQYKNAFNSIPEKERITYVNNLNNALNKLSSNNVKQINEQKTLNSLQKQLNDISYKYEGFSNTNVSNGLQSQIDTLRTLNPQTNEYRLLLAEVKKQLQEYKNETINVANAEKNRISQQQTIANLQNKLNNVNGSNGSKLVSSASISEAQAMIDKLNGMTAGTVNYQNATKQATDAVNNLVRQGQQLNSVNVILRTMSQLFMLGSPIMIANRALREMMTTVNELNHSMTEIRLVSGMSYESVLKLRDGYNELGKTIGATTKQVMDSAIEFTRQGRSIAETQELLSSAIMGAKLSGTATADMTEYLTSAINGYSVSAKDAITVIDKLVAVDNSSASSMSELSIAMSRTAKSAQLAGVDISELIGYIGTISSVTRKSSETIGESLKTIFSRYQNVQLGKWDEDGIVASDVRKAMSAVNIEIMKTEDTFRDFSDVLNELSGKWDTLSQAEQSAVATAMAGVRQRENFLVLMDNMAMATDLTTTAMDSNGLAMDRYNIYLESTEAKLNTFKATLEGVWSNTLNSDTVNNLIEMATSVLQLVDNMGGLVPVLATVGTALASIKNVGGAKCCPHNTPTPIYFLCEV